MRPLVIYESPNKFKTFASIFKNMDVSFSYTQGRIYDLPDNHIGLDNNMAPTLVAVNSNREAFLKDKISKHDSIYCLTDNDPEGEWIALHIKEMCQEAGKKFLRIRLAELTKEALDDAMKSSSDLIDEDLLTKAISRRVIDRFLGYHDNENKDLKRGRVLSPMIHYIHQESPSIGCTALLIDKNGAEVTLRGDKNQIIKLISAITESKELTLTEGDGHASTEPLFNTIDYLLERCTYASKTANDAFEELQSMYEQGLVSYTRTENTKYSVMDGQHRGIYSINTDLSSDDDDKETNLPLDRIRQKTKFHLNPDKYKVTEFTSSAKLRSLAKELNVSIESIVKKERIPNSFHEVVRPILSNKNTAISKNKVNSYVFPHNSEVEILLMMKALDLATPATFHMHASKLIKLTTERNGNMVLNAHGIRVATQTDHLSLQLMEIQNVQKINALLSNNTLSIEQKNKRCLNVLRISTAESSSFGLDT